MVQKMFKGEENCGVVLKRPWKMVPKAENKSIAPSVIFGPILTGWRQHMRWTCPAGS